MQTILLATESDDLFRTIDAALVDDKIELQRITKGSEVLPAIRASEPEFVILDMQIGNMGGIASCIAIRQEEGAQRLDKRPVALLLDRKDDIYVAQQAKADGWLVKPLDSLRLRKLYTALVDGGHFFEQATSVSEPLR